MLEKIGPDFPSLSVGAGFGDQLQTPAGYSGSSEPTVVGPVDVLGKISGDFASREVLVVQNPTVTLKGDVEATRRIIAKARNPVALVGHSYGGAVITEAGTDAKVQKLVYIAAFAPEIGESVFELATRPMPGEASPPLLPPSDGFLIVDPDKFPTAFAADVDLSTTRLLADAQVPWGLGAVQPKLTAAARRLNPPFSC